MGIVVPVPTSKTATARFSTPVRICYRCSSCGMNNADDSNKINIEYSVSGSVFANSTRLQESARKELYRRLAFYIRDKIRAIESGKCRKHGVSCSCSYCGYKEPWAERLIPDWLLVLGIFFPIIAFFLFIANMTVGNGNVAFLMQVFAIVLAAIALSIWIFYFVRSVMLEYKNKKLPRESKPSVKLLDQQIEILLKTMNEVNRRKVEKASDETVIPIEKDESFICPVCQLQQAYTNSSCRRCQRRFIRSGNVKDEVVWRYYCPKCDTTCSDEGIRPECCSSCGYPVESELAYRIVKHVVLSEDA